MVLRKSFRFPRWFSYEFNNTRYKIGVNSLIYTFQEIFGEGNGNPLQCSCLENPRDGGAWWAAVYGVAQSRTRLKRLSSSSSSSTYIKKKCMVDFPGGSDGKESVYITGDLGLIPGLGKSPGGGPGNPHQYSCLENPHGQRSQRAPVQGVAESDTTERQHTQTLSVF